MSGAAHGDPFARILAQDDPIRVLRAALAEGRLPSAYLFEGPSGVGKEKTALALAIAALGPAQAPRVDKGNHPDVRIFRPRDDGHRNIKVETLREDILPFASFAPFEADRAFLIFPESDVSFPEAHPESANALLKTLEEPKRGVTFVLLAERPDRLLPTIRSRCQALRFDRLPANLIEELLGEAGVAEADRGAAVALADGRADRALALAEGGTARTLLDLATNVDAALHAKAPGSLVNAAEALAKAPDPDLALEALMLFYRDVAAACAGLPDDALAYRHGAHRIREAAARIDVACAAERVALVQQARDDLERNANRATACDALVFRMRSPRIAVRNLPPRRMG